jgi:hypothetical protein
MPSWKVLQERASDDSQTRAATLASPRARCSIASSFQTSLPLIPTFSCSFDCSANSGRLTDQAELDPTG